MNESKLISICIPCYEMGGMGKFFLNENLKKIENQTYKNIQVVVSDHSSNNDIEDLCTSWSETLNIKYIRNKKNIGSSSSNVNYAIDNSDGDLIKILFQDDFLYSDESIRLIVENFEDTDKWLITACIHTIDGVEMFNEHYPKWNEFIHLGNNTISSPSVLTITKEINIRFDENLIWLMDCDMYKRLYDEYGHPKILSNINVVNRIWGGRLSDIISQETKESEFNKMKNKYK